MKKITLFLTSLFVSITMFSQTQMSGEYTVGTGGTYDYASMADAGMAIKAAEFTGDVTLLICTDLTETINTGIVNKSEYTLTIRPDKDENRTITYTTATDNTGPTGVFVIGGDMTKTPGSTIGWASVPTKNVVVDGEKKEKTTRSGNWNFSGFSRNIQPRNLQTSSSRRDTKRQLPLETLRPSQSNGSRN